MATIGVPDEEWGEEVKAVVQPADGVEPSEALAAELMAFCRDRLAHFKCPRPVDFMAELPREDTGKIYKRKLREQIGATRNNPPDTAKEKNDMGICDGRIVVITGAGRGIGREHALEFASQGAKVVVNDLGAEMDGTGAPRPAGEVVDEIRAMGGEAVANGDDVSDWDGAGRLIQTAIDTFGTIDVLVNNAGILRDRMLVNMTIDEWDAVIKVHLRGTFAPTRHAVEYWRNRTKAGETNDARVINTTSPSGIYGNVGQTNYGAAKAGIASFTIIAAMELNRYGVTVNAIAPAALTRMTENLGMADTTPEQQARGVRPARPGQHLPAGGVAGQLGVAGRHRPCLQRDGRHHLGGRGLGGRPGPGQGRPLGPGRTGPGHPGPGGQGGAERQHGRPAPLARRRGTTGGRFVLMDTTNASTSAPPPFRGDAMPRRPSRSSTTTPTRSSCGTTSATGANW